MTYIPATPRMNESNKPAQFGLRFLFWLMLLSGLVAMIGRLAGWPGIFGLVCLTSPMLVALLFIWIPPASTREFVSTRDYGPVRLNASDNRASRLPLKTICFIAFSAAHTLLMWSVALNGYEIVIWLFVDFPISWVAFVILEFGIGANIGKIGSHAIFLVAGSLQWGLLGWLLGKVILQSSKSHD